MDSTTIVNSVMHSSEYDQARGEASVSLRANMVHTTKDRDVYDYYNIERIIGEGSMGSVSLVRKKDEKVGGSAYKRKGLLFGTQNKNAPETVLADAKKKVYALKSILLTKVSDDFLEELRNEISILQSLDHPNIVKAYEVYESKINIYLVLENCSGGDLYSREPYSEKAAAKIVGKLLSAIAYMHRHGCTHRDLKYENVMFESCEEDAEIKLIDFGLANKSISGSPDSEFMTTGVGTIYTVAPEVLNGSYTSMVDLWSIGVMAYMLLSSSKPFHERSRRRMMLKIKQGEYSFYSKRWDNISQESQDFVCCLIVVDPKTRLTGEQALEHKWLSDEFPLSERIPDEDFLGSVQESIADYADVGEFKKMALMVIAHKSSSAEIVQLRKAFDSYDTTNDGVISFAEFKTAMSSSDNYTEKDIEEIFQNLDTGKDGQIYYTEFLAATLEAHGRIVEETLADAFDRMDCDDTGYISEQNLRDFLGTDATTEKVEKLMAEVDSDGDGKISFEEFVTSFRNNQRSIGRTLGCGGNDVVEGNVKA